MSEQDTVCTRTAGHDGPCNGFPRLLDPNRLGVYCRPLHGRVKLPYSGPATQSLGEYVCERLDLIEAHEATIQEMRATIERLERALRYERCRD